MSNEFKIRIWKSNRIQPWCYKVLSTKTGEVIAHGIGLDSRADASTWADKRIREHQNNSAPAT